MRKWVFVVCAVAGAWCALTSCNKPVGANEGTSSASAPALHVDAATAGTIYGRVVFRGKAPAMPGIDFSSNPQCERGHRGKPVHAETVVVNPNGTLANTLVWISGGLPQGRWEPPAPSVKLDQSGCVYKPHVLALMTGQDLEVFNSDPVNHNVHAEASVNPATNDMEPPRAETIHKRFSQQEIWIPFTCSVHPWMRAYVAVISHPFFAVTGADGSFQIAGVPPGKYTLETVHEKYGRKTTEITVSARQNGQADFEYGE